MYRYLPPNYDGKVIYDCMDNHEALCNDKEICKTIRKTEQQLVKRADIVFASSTGLLKKSAEPGRSDKKYIDSEWFCGRSYISAGTSPS